MIVVINICIEHCLPPVNLINVPPIDKSRSTLLLPISSKSLRRALITAALNLSLGIGGRADAKAKLASKSPHEFISRMRHLSALWGRQFNYVTAHMARPHWPILLVDVFSQMRKKHSVFLLRSELATLTIASITYI